MISTELSTTGANWLAEQIDGLTDEIISILPSDYNEQNRYLPKSVTPLAGYIDFDVNPYMREIVNCFDVNSPVREVNLKKGVQITYTTVLESGMLYFMGHVKTLPMMYITADKELAQARVENNVIPMLNHSKMAGIIRSADIGNTRKTGKTANHLQFEGGGYLVPFGAKNANKMRQYSICIMLKDEIDAWPDVVGKDGDPDKITDDRCSGYWEQRKIFRGSTPLIEGTSKIDKAFLRGDQRKYEVLCKHCGFPQALRWQTKDKSTGIMGGFQWEMEDGVLLLESVCYCCQNCGKPHFERDKERLFSESHGAKWVPTARPEEPNIRSYHLPALYSPVGMQPWYKCVTDYLQGFDAKRNRVKDIGKYQVFYNNILAKSFKIIGAKITRSQVSAHRLAMYRMGRIPNDHAAEYSGSPVLFLSCLVDVHKNNLAVTIIGWCRDAISYIIDYWRFEAGEGENDDCSELSNPVWQQLRDVIEKKEYTADDGKRYSIAITLVDAGYANATVTNFCADYTSGVYPILGRDRSSKNARIREFEEFKTQGGTIGFKIVVDHYKDRLGPVLRREWIKQLGDQQPYHFNAPVDITDKQLEELTVETRRKKTDARGVVTYEWYRPSGRRNELWDLLVYGHASVDILAWTICIEHFKLKTIDWDQFWRYVETEELYFIN